jgi:Protein of unknown function (DUF2934)
MNQLSPQTAPSPAPFYDPQRRHEMIAQAAYFRARHRGFRPGHELEDWLAAEAEVDGELTVGLRMA